MAVDMHKLTSLCKRRGFIFPNSEIYGGLSSVFDYGPWGTELKRNVKEAWWRSYVRERSDIYGLDSSILMHPDVWKASGHLESFADALVDCKGCKKRLRQDELSSKGKGIMKCPECGAKIDLAESPPRMFNLMLKTALGPIEDKGSICYLRPETAQGIFVNFANLLDTMHPELPFGVAQIGKAFRNEVTIGNLTFRTREFEQMEIEYFVKPEEDQKHYESWIEERFNWYIKLGIKEENLRKKAHTKDELAHYAKACTDIEYHFGFGWAELEGVANRCDFDLREHARLSGRDLKFFDPQTNKKFLPHIIEPSGGVDRTVLAFLSDAYREEEVRGRKRVVLGLHKNLAPIKVAVLPLLKNRPELVELAKKIAGDLKGLFPVLYDDTAAIGKLYRRQDEIGTPFCVTVDVQSIEDKCVTVRLRDSMEQERVSTSKLKEYLKERLEVK